MESQTLAQHLTLEEFCTCTQTYQRHAEQIDPYPKNLEGSLPAIESLCKYVIDPVIDEFGRERFQLTYGFCSADLKWWLAKKDPVTGLKNGRVSPFFNELLIVVRIFAPHHPMPPQFCPMPKEALLPTATVKMAFTSSSSPQLRSCWLSLANFS
jgi:hypothetical protein